jgi:hypothetical protein
MVSMHILASDFSGLAWIILAIPASLAALALVSFIPASRGHWSALLLAAAPVLLGSGIAGLLIFASARSGHMPLAMVALLLAPPVLGILSIGVWSERRRSREARAALERRNP